MNLSGVRFGVFRRENNPPGSTGGEQTRGATKKGELKASLSYIQRENLQAQCNVSMHYKVMEVIK